MSGDPVLAALARIENGLTDLGGRLTELEDRQTRLEEGQTKLRVDLMERMDRFENRLTTIQDDIGVNMGGVTTVFDRLAATRRESDATASMLQMVIRQVHRLQNDVEELKKR